MGRLFGTDGVRGIANQDLTATLAFQLAQASAVVLRQDHPSQVVLIGKDTRQSCDMLEAALSAGFLSMGLSVIRLGVIPTPGVAWLTRSTDAVCGVMISASHNPAEYNGIKFFSHDGYKLPDETEDAIEALIQEGQWKFTEPQTVGVWQEDRQLPARYEAHLKQTIEGDLKGLTMVLDTANGAASYLAPAIFQSLGATVHVIHHEPDGQNINRNCGSTHTHDLQQKVVETGSQLGFAFDGDADRLIAVDETGCQVDGDRIMAMLALKMKEADKLPENTLVSTVMSNLGLELAMKDAGCRLMRTKVGDRYVLEEMKKNQYTLGGEQSGHIIMAEHATTGDGILTALQLAALVKEKQEKLSQLASVMTSYPQVLVNARVHQHLKEAYLKDPEIVREIKYLEDRMAGQGRVLIRPSGTEALVRVMLEGADQQQLNTMATSLAGLIEQRLGS
ncbi:phosphoglucosamine mutase [Anoxynatronum sibiricum]|uniref:Phosphoglucosamine mutase n=1 Tax=Anoxynatronum sibiricum TaxID=210623 RepID=A0ABU9VS20_9CLOT